MTDTKELLSGYDIMNASHAERIAHAKSIAEGFIRSAAQADFGETDGYSYIYAYGLTAGWHHGALISESEMVEYRQRLSAVVADREDRDGFDEADDDSAELEQAWSISARLAAVSVEGTHLLPLAVVDLVQEARCIHPTVAHAAALRGNVTFPAPVEKAPEVEHPTVLVEADRRVTIMSGAHRIADQLQRQGVCVVKHYDSGDFLSVMTFSDGSIRCI